MELLLQLASDQSGLPTPELRLWDWQQEIWAEVAAVQWGVTPIPDFAPYVGANNRVRIRLQHSDSINGLHIMGVYPILTGSLPE